MNADVGNNPLEKALGGRMQGRSALAEPTGKSLNTLRNQMRCWRNSWITCTRRTVP